MLTELVRKSRSYRRFHENEPLETDKLLGLIELARLSPSGANLQPLKYLIADSPEINAKIFPCLSWAGYLKDWPGPASGDRPPAYIIILGDQEIAKSFGVDHGIAAQSIMLGAAEQGLGGCIIGSVNRTRLAENLNLKSHLEILLVLAIGRPKETVVIEPLGNQGDIKYWRDDDDIHRVPKRPLQNLVISLEN